MAINYIITMGIICIAGIIISLLWLADVVLRYNGINLSGRILSAFGMPEKRRVRLKNGVTVRRYK